MMKRRVRVNNLSRKTVILQEASVAATFLQRLRGLLGHKGLPSGRGLLIKPCRAVHTCGMAFPLDIAFVDGEDRICYLREGMPPYRFSPVIREASYVLEAPAGTLRRAQTQCGDMIALEMIAD
jgi:uncharacterized membrane protein (UPF0127 family)